MNLFAPGYERSLFACCDTVSAYLEANKRKVQKGKKRIRAQECIDSLKKVSSTRKPFTSLGKWEVLELEVIEALRDCRTFALDLKNFNLRVILHQLYSTSVVCSALGYLNFVVDSNPSDEGRSLIRDIRKFTSKLAQDPSEGLNQDGTSIVRRFSDLMSSQSEEYGLRIAEHFVALLQERNSSNN